MSSDKDDFFSKYENNVSDELFLHLIRSYRTYTLNESWMNQPIKYIYIDGKQKILTNNKKRMVNKIYSLEEERWFRLGESIIRRTIKKFLDCHLIV